MDLSQDPPAWTEHGRLNVPRTHLGVGAINDTLLIAAGGNEYDFAVRGYHHSTIRKTVEVFDLSNPGKGWQQRTPLPAAAGWVASSVCRGKFYVMGGLRFSESNTQHRHKATYCYDAEKDRWKNGAPFPVPISGWEAATFQDRFIIAVGGVLVPDARPVQDYTSDLIQHTRWNDVAFAYDTHHDRWYRLDGALPPGGKFNDPGVCIIGNTIYVAGAEGPSGGHYNYFLIGRIKIETDSG